MVFIIGHLESTKYTYVWFEEIVKKIVFMLWQQVSLWEIMIMFCLVCKNCDYNLIAKIQFIFWTRLNSDSRSKNAAFFIDQKVNTVTIHSLLNNIRRSLLWANTTACINFFSNCYGWWANMAFIQYIVCTTIIYCYNL